MATIETLLIANRGEIAVRVARTARRLGMATVGVYSEPDRNALHCDAVDRAVSLGGASPAESYLRGDAIIEAALATHADAVHPGYGFLAENAEFAQGVIDAGLIWVGPTPEHIRLLGDKIAAKRVAIDAGVPTTPIVEVADPDATDDGTFQNLSYPALVKAAAGGGGRGMRVVRSNAELAEAIASASREARSAFGDGTVFIEPFIERGRHIEVQILGDTSGNVVHLGDRECSIQRRNQKIIEEAPAPRLDDDTRSALHEGAVALARRVGYVGAGTVEFMVADVTGESTGGEPNEDPRAPTDKPTITFLEVNTRLQVEHPVTEAVTGVDLVELQLRIAEGRPLPFTQSDVTIDGHAIEGRLVAEDPAEDWLPSTGRLTDFRIGDPDGSTRSDSIRVDAGVREGSVVSSDYDSLLAKVICHDAERETAARRLAAVLRSARISGARTNASTLAAIMVEPDFLAASTPTSYLADHPAVTRSPSLPGDARDAHFIAAVLALELHHRRHDTVTGFAPSGWRNLRTRGVRRILTLDDLAADVSTSPAGRGAELHGEYVVEQYRHGLEVEIALGRWPEADAHGALPSDERKRSRVRILERTADRQVLEIDGLRQVIDVRVHDEAIHTASFAGVATWHIPPTFESHDSIDVGIGPVSPLPGTVISVHVEAGRVVVEGELLMVVEAMKMEHRIVATAAAIVTEVRFEVGDRVDTGDLLVALDSTAGQDGTQDSVELQDEEAAAADG